MPLRRAQEAVGTLTRRQLKNSRRAPTTKAAPSMKTPRALAKGSSASHSADLSVSGALAIARAARPRSSGRHLVELLQRRIDSIPLMATHPIRHRSRLVSARVVQARRVHRE
jgi:hypothetical protein